MLKVPDAAAYATIHFLENVLNRRCGGSTGTNLYAAFQIIAELKKQNTETSIVSMICDGGERYLDTYYNPDWRNDLMEEMDPSEPEPIVFPDLTQ